MRTRLTRTSSRLALVLLGAVLTAASASAVEACGGNGHPGNPPDLVSEGGGVDPGQDAGYVADAATKPDAGFTGDAGALGTLPVVQITSGACAMTGGTSSSLPLTDGGAPIAGYGRLGAAGARQFIADLDNGSITLFDPPAATPSNPIQLQGIRWGAESEGANLGVAWAASDNVYYARMDPTGTMQTPVIAGAGIHNADALAFAGSASGSLLAFAVYVYGRINFTIVNAAGDTAGSTFPLGAGTFHNRVSIAAASDGAGEFAVVWAGDSTAGDKDLTSVYFSKAGPKGAASGANKLFTVQRALRVQRLVQTASGYALILNGATDSSLDLVMLDSKGVPVVPAHSFSGTLTGWDLTATATEVGLVASIGTDDDAGGRLFAPVFRPLDLTGAPKSDWVCLGPAASYGESPSNIALESDTKGNFTAALADAVNGGTKVIQMNALGTAPPL